MTDTTGTTTTTTDAGASSQAITSSDAGAGGAAAAGQTTTDQAPASYLDSFADEQLRGSPTLARYKSPEDLARAHILLEKRMGVPAHRLLTMPDKPADQDPEGWKTLYAALGRPETVDGYGIKLPDTATDFDKTTFGDFAAKMYAAGASKAQMDVATAEFARAMQVTAERAQADQAARLEAGKVEVEKHFGAKLATYKTDITNLLHATGADGKPILTDEEIKALDGDLKDHSLPFMKLLAHVTDQLAEPETLDGQGQGVTPSRGLSPTQAKSARLQLENDPVKGKALRDARDPQHAQVKAERERYFAYERGEKPTT